MNPLDAYVLYFALQIKDYSMSPAGNTILVTPKTVVNALQQLSKKMEKCQVVPKQIKQNATNNSYLLILTIC